MSANSRNPLALIIVPLGTLGLLLFAHTVLENAVLASAFMSRSFWTRLVDVLGGAMSPADTDSATIPILGPLSLGILGAAALAWSAGASLLRGSATYTQSLLTWGLRGWSWWLAPGAWWLLWTFTLPPGGPSWTALLIGTAELWFCVPLAGWITTGWSLRARTLTATTGVAGDAAPGRSDSHRRTFTALALAIVVYVVAFTGINWGLWFNLRLPHGDSAMYEEHLWNLEHGKGFRSYLDQGLFLGEHLQVIHVALVPLHVFWPSQLLLELCESLALASGAVPVFLIARRHSGSNRIALLLSVTWLLYFPLQYLDVAIDLKTFRPIAFGVPLLLWAIDRMERRRYASMTVLLLLTLSAKEDYAIVICLLGLWLCISSTVGGWRGERSEGRAERKTLNSPPIILGGVMAVLAGVYLLAAVKFVIPWFRGGDTVHYARYFEQFGDTPGEILLNMLNPALLWDALVTAPSVLLALRLLAPLALLPLLSPGRFLVGVPLIVLLCLNEIARSFPAPVHHFHAPLLPILFWAAAAGLGNLARRAESRRALAPVVSLSRMLFAARLACACALTTGLFWSLSPLGRQFWDAGSATYWRDLYVPGERAHNFERIAALIPADAHVASTDFVHARLTHCERSYDYSDYPRAVADYEDRVPHDTGYIVIDVEHPYHDPQKIAALRNDPYGEVRELIREPERWELLPETGNGYFLVLRRRQ